MTFVIGDIVNMEWADDLPMTKDDMNDAKIIEIYPSECPDEDTMYLLELRNGITIDAGEDEIIATTNLLDETGRLR